MRPDEPILAEGDVVQLSPNVGNPMFAGCMMIVTEQKTFGAQGYVQALGENGKPGGQAFYRAQWSEMEYVGQCAWIRGDGDEEEATP
jgi:hypothetical protein